LSLQNKSLKSWIWDAAFPISAACLRRRTEPHLPGGWLAPDAPPADLDRNRSLFFALQLRRRKAEGALLGKLSHFHTDIYGNWDFRFPRFVLR
jgi:hypothetical protein